MAGTFGSGTIGGGTFGSPLAVLLTTRKYRDGAYGSGSYGGDLELPPPPVDPGEPPVIVVPPFVPSQPVPAVYALFARDGHLRRTAEITHYQSFKGIMRFNDSGTWTLVLNANAAAAPLLRFVDNPDTDILPPGIILTQDGEELFSGVVKSVQVVKNDDGDVQTVNGVDDTGLLADRIALPNLPGQDYSSQEADIRTGIASTVLMQFVDNNAGPGVDDNERQIPHLALGVDRSFGKTVTGEARLDNLLDLLKKVAADGGVRFQIRQPADTQQLLFEVDHPEDRSQWVIFSRDLGSIASSTVLEAVSSVNAILGGGKGEGTERSFSQDRDDRSVRRYSRIEKFVDLRDVEDDDLHDRIDTMLNEGREQLTVTLSPNETANTQFGRTYRLGDIVAFWDDDRQYLPTINEVAISLDDKGAVILPTLTTSPQKPPQQLGGITRELDTRISTIERTTGVPGGNFITLWYGDVNNVPDGWLLCDGNNGTPDMRGRVPLGSGGQFATGAHSSAATPNGEGGDGKRTSDYYDNAQLTGSGKQVSTAGHRHVLPFYALVFLMRRS